MCLIIGITHYHWINELSAILYMLTCYEAFSQEHPHMFSWLMQGSLWLCKCYSFLMQAVSCLLKPCCWHKLLTLIMSAGISASSFFLSRLLILLKTLQKMLSKCEHLQLYSASSCYHGKQCLQIDRLCWLNTILACNRYRSTWKTWQWCEQF